MLQLLTATAVHPLFLAYPQKCSMLLHVFKCKGPASFHLMSKGLLHACHQK